MGFCHRPDRAVPNSTLATWGLLLPRLHDTAKWIGSLVWHLNWRAGINLTPPAGALPALAFGVPLNPSNSGFGFLACGLAGTTSREHLAGSTSKETGVERARRCIGGQIRVQKGDHHSSTVYPRGYPSRHAVSFCR